MDEREQDIVQRHLAPFIASKFFNTITEDDILKKGENGWLHNGKPLTKGQIDVYKKEAVLILNSKVFPILLSELQFFARQTLEKAVTETDIINAKLLSYFVDLVNSKLKKIAEL